MCREYGVKCFKGSRYAGDLPRVIDIVLKGDEARHLKVLRKREGERISLTSGTGIFAEAELSGWLQPILEGATHYAISRFLNCMRLVPSMRTL